MAARFATKAEQSKPLLRLLKPHIPKIHSYLVLRHLSTEPINPLQKQNGDEEKFIAQVVQLLQPPENDWNFEKLRLLLFSDSTTPSPTRLFRIASRLDSSSKALKFLDYLQSNSPTPDKNSLSSTFQAVLVIASREPSSQSKLLELYKASRERGIALTINAASLLIRCFGRAGMVDELLLVYNELHPSSKNTPVRTLLIGELLRYGCVDDANNVLDEMLELNAEFPPNDVTGNVVFAKLLKRERPGRHVSDEEIVGLVFKFGKHGVFPGKIQLTQLISRLCRNGKTDRAWDVLDNVMKSGGLVEAASCNALLTGLGRKHDFKRINLLMAEMKERDIHPDVVTFGIVINYLCKSRRVDEALEVFEKMKGEGDNDRFSVERDVITYNTLIDGLCKVGRQEEGLQLMKRMRLENGCAPNTVTYNCLIDGFNKVGEIERARELFDEMKKEKVPPNVITLNTLVDGMCKHGRVSSAVEFFNEAQNDGLKANVFTYTNLISAFCNVNNINKAMQLFDQMLSDGCTTDAKAYYCLISGLCLAGRLDDASLVVSKLKEAGFCMDAISYNTLINGFCKKNKLEKAYGMLKEMEDEGVKPDVVTYNTLISYSSKTGNLKTAYKLLRKMISEGLVPTVFTHGALIHGFCLSGNINTAMKIFKDMSSSSKVPPNTVIYNILIDSLCKKNEVELALSLMDEMRIKGVKPDTTTYNAMFKGLREKNLLDKAFKFMDQMVEHACGPDYITMEILTEWLSAVGETDKLKKFTKGYEVSAATA
ncbi:hypothetical protein FEM48_Zijuj12G0157200 [Ziziphus jujuba var. spinosa]|uniref:Pentatricopeptide repeat-containing protein At3g61520, mitochondrial-like n=1 Tax=Ziziphus jujuba var. spinosa TaxID=714518 RepID=A0A978UE74_ZIZJJ|nr:hypothetical protein FEM48_Zijuj12G0157200 [Ziziphus jujuba var. spinosa]